MKKPPLIFIGDLGTELPEIYLNIDHLKKGTYIIHITQKDRIINTIKVIKQ